MWNIKVLILIAFVASTGAFVVNDSDDRILGSYPVPPRHLTYTAQVVGKSSNGTVSHCAGAILSPRFVLITAVCGKAKPTTATVLTGSNERLKGRSVPVAEIIIHPQFKAERLQNNLALIRTGQDIKYDNYALEVLLPHFDMSDNGGDEMTIAGWGAIYVRTIEI